MFNFLPNILPENFMLNFKQTFMPTLEPIKGCCIRSYMEIIELPIWEQDWFIITTSLTITGIVLLILNKVFK